MRILEGYKYQNCLFFSVTTCYVRDCIGHFRDDSSGEHMILRGSTIRLRCKLPTHKHVITCDSQGSYCMASYSSVLLPEKIAYTYGVSKSEISTWVIFDYEVAMRKNLRNETLIG